MTINQDKSQLLFFNTPTSIQRHLTGINGYQQSKIPYEYLSVPLVENSLKKTSWDDMLSRMAKKIENWSLCTLNIASCLILIELVLQAIPIYRFSTLATPKYILNAISNLHFSFLWGSSKKK
jgi:hypothetical protein